MPQIAEYNAAVENIHPSETGEVSLARAGTTIRAESRMTAGEYQQAFQDVGGSLKKVGELMDAHDALHEISTGAALAATNYNNIQKGWDDLAKDPGTAADPQAGQKYLEQVQPQWEKFQAGFLTPQGKKWAADYVERAQEHLGEKITRDQSTLAGINLQNMVKTWGNQTTLAIATDPPSLGFHLGEIGPTVGAMLKNSPMLSAEDNARVRDGMTRELKEAFQKTAMQSIARLDPGRAEGMLKAGAFPDVNGAEATSTISTERRVLASEARANRSLAIQQRMLNSQTAARSVIDQGVSQNSDGSFTVKPGAFDAALHNKNILPNEAVTVFKFLEGAQNANVKPENSDANAFALRQHAFDHPDQPMDEFIFRAANENKISRQQALQISEDYHRIHDDPVMLKTWSSPEVQSVLKEAQSVLIGDMTLGAGLWGKGPAQHDYSAFTNWFTRELSNRMRNGEDVHDLLNPQSNSYILKDGKLGSFKNTSASIDAAIQGINPPGAGSPAGLAAAQKHMNLESDKK